MQPSNPEGGGSAPAPAPAPTPAPAPAPAGAPAAAGIAGAPAAAAPAAQRITRELIAELFRDSSVQALPLVVTQHAKVVELLIKHLRLPLKHTPEGMLTGDSNAHYERCWRAVDCFLIGWPIDEAPYQAPFSRSLRTTNFCVDLFDDFRRHPQHLPVDRYLKTRQALLDHTVVAVGRFELHVNQFINRGIDLQQSRGGDILRAVPALSTLEPARVFAFRKCAEIRTLFGWVAFAEEVQQSPASLQPLFVTTGRRVVLKCVRCAIGRGWGCGWRLRCQRQAIAAVFCFRGAELESTL
jgi:hypothetical protein